MNLTIDSELLLKLEKAKIRHPMVLAGQHRYRNDVEFSAFSVPRSYLTKLQAYLAKDSKTHSKLLQKLSQFFDVVRKGQEMTPKRLDTLESALMNAIVKTSPKRWLWSLEDGLPYVVESIRYRPGEKECPASVSVSMRYTAKGETKNRNFSYGQSDIQENKTIALLLMGEGYVTETAELVAAYEKRMADWQVVYDAHFQQFILTTENLNKDAGESDYYHSRELVHSATNRGEFRVVNDVPVAKLGRQSEYISIKSMPIVSDDEEGADEAEQVEEEYDEDAVSNFVVPLHPYVLVFNLETHDHMWVLSEKLTRYSYNTALVDKLILPARHKTLIKLLTSDIDILRADIVAGKSAGTIVLCYGEPGLGKTLTAEGFSEATQKILYRVQSDQLGTEPDELEKKLRQIFANAQRWDAVLLIDEVDIYVHERGLDIVQNAIVGTLLRTLEYFSGIIFMTTNRDLVIDDAILSRCSAVIRYDYPGDEDAEILYEMFGELFGLTLTKPVVQEFRKSHPRLSGRTIKNVLRLTARRGALEPTVQDLLDTKEFVVQQTRPEATTA